MMNRIYFGDNLPILREMPSESVDLIYIDPPFNTGKIQARKTIRTIKDENGDRKGFQGNIYQTIDLGTKAYQDSFDFIDGEVIKPEIISAYQILAPSGNLNYIEGFLKPRIEQAYRILKPHGSLYFHIDYREAHYCRILLDRIFGRNCFLNEIIWAYDFGGRARSRWPAKHDNIFFYVKDPKNYIFNTSEIDRERYMAPGLVGQDKVERGKLPTDTWFWGYVGKKNPDIWWRTIVGTNSKEKKGYPTQKPRGIIDRIIKASSYPGSLVFDFFAGSGTIGESCLELNRNFILIDNNKDALEIIARRFSGINNIEWINYDPKPFQSIQEKKPQNDPHEQKKILDLDKDFMMLAATASYLQKNLEEQIDFWKGSPFEWVLQLPARSKGKLARNLIYSWCKNNGLSIDKPKDSSESLLINNHRFAIKFSTLWKNRNYKFQQIREQGYDYVICLGISPLAAHCWVFSREYALHHATPQHKGAKGSEYWMAINPDKPPEWVINCGGALDQALQVILQLK